MRASLREPSLQTILYQETINKRSATRWSDQDIDEIKKNLIKEMSAERGKGIQTRFHTVQENTIKEIDLVKSTKGGLSQISQAYERMRELSIAALRNTTTHERTLLDEEYQYQMKLIKNIAKETEYGGQNLIDADPRFLKVQLKNDAYRQLQQDPPPFLVLQNIDGIYEEEPEEDALPNHSILSGKTARNALQSIDTAISQIEEVKSSLQSVEARLITQVKDFALGLSRHNPLRAPAEALGSAVETAQSIFANAQTSLLTQTEQMARASVQSLFLTDI